MSSIEENAFQIARYLLENPEKNGHSEIKDSLGFSDSDFQRARKFLVDAKCFQSAGKPSTGIVIQKNLARLQEFVNRISKTRVSLSLDAERLLKTLFDAQVDFPFSLGNHIMTDFNWNENKYKQVAQELEDNGFVQGDYASGNPFFKISMTSPGRQIVRNNFHSPNAQSNSLQIIGNNNIVTVSSTLNSVHQFVQANSSVDLSSKQELEILLQKLEAALNEVPDKNENDVEAVANMAKNLIESATREKPNKPLSKISAEGLKKAAENIAVITPNVLLTAQAIIDFVMTNYPSLLV